MTTPMKTPMRFALRAVLLLTAAALMGVIVMLLWNAVLPALFEGARPVGYLHALGLLALWHRHVGISALTGSHAGVLSGAHRPWRLGGSCAASYRHCLSTVMSNDSRVPVFNANIVFKAHVLADTAMVVAAVMSDIPTTVVIMSTMVIAAVPSIIPTVTVVIVPTIVVIVPHIPIMDRAVIPVVAMAVERPVAVMPAPVIADHEADDRNADARTVARQQHATIVVVVFEVVACDPASFAVGDHVAPEKIVDATLDRNGSSSPKGRDQRVVRIGCRTQVQIGGDVGVLRIGGC